MYRLILVPKIVHTQNHSQVVYVRVDAFLRTRLTATFAASISSASFSASPLPSCSVAPPPPKASGVLVLAALSFLPSLVVRSRSSSSVFSSSRDLRPACKEKESSHALANLAKTRCVIRETCLQGSHAICQRRGADIFLFCSALAIISKYLRLAHLEARVPWHVLDRKLTSASFHAKVALVFATHGGVEGRARRCGHCVW